MADVPGTAGGVAPAAEGKGKELTKEQLLAFIKRQKQRLKDTEGDLATTKAAHAALQTEHLALEETAAALAEKDRATDNRLIQAAEEMHQAQAQSDATAKALQARVVELEAALAHACRTQDGQIELAERAKRAETEARRAQERLGVLEAEAAKAPAADEEGEVAKLQAENEELGGKLKQLVERYKTLQTRAKGVVEEKNALEEQLIKANAQLEAAVAAAPTAAPAQHQDAAAEAEELVRVRAERDELNARLAAVQAETKDAREALATQHGQALAALEADRMSLQGQVTRLTQQLGEATAAAHAQDDQALAVLEQERNALQTEVARLGQQLQVSAEEARTTAQGLEKEVQRLRSDMAAAAARRASTPVPSSADAELLATKEEELAALRRSLEEHKAEGVALQQGQAEKQQELADAQVRVEALEAQKKEQDEAVKRLKTLLAKSRNVIQSRDLELSKSKAAAESGAAAPSTFTVSMRVRNEGEGAVWCCLVLPPPPPASAEDGAAAVPPTTATTTSRSTWVTEDTAREWTRLALENQPGSVAPVSAWPPVLQEAWGVKEAGLTQALQEVQDAKRILEEEFGKYKARAHAALKKATERSGDEKQRDRQLEEENARLADERVQWERVAQGLEERVKEMEATLREAHEQHEDQLEVALREHEQALAHERGRSNALVAEIEAKAELRRREIVAEYTKNLEARERECNLLTGKIQELDTQLKAAQAAAAEAAAAAARARAEEKAKTATTALGTSTSRSGTASTTTSTSTSSTTPLVALAPLPQPPSTPGKEKGEQGRGHDTALGAGLPPLDIPAQSLSASGCPTGSLESATGDDLANLGDQYVVIKQLTSDFQAERSRDLQLIAQMQEEISSLNSDLARLQEQERAVKAALRLVEDNLARERELHKGPVNAEYLKHAIYGFLTASNDTERLTLLSVITTILHFTPAESAKARASVQAGWGVGAGTVKRVGAVTGWLSSKLTGGGGGGGEGGEETGR